MKSLIIKGAKVIDIINKDFYKKDVLVEGGKIKLISKNIKKKNSRCKIIDAQGLYLFPGFIDLHCHIREPGREDKESIKTASLSAQWGGFTTILSMPNTEVCLDTPEKISSFVNAVKSDSTINIYPCGALTQGRKGQKICEYALMMKEGALAFSDDGNWIEDSSVMMLALNYLSSLGGLCISHCEDAKLTWGPGRDDLLSFKLGLLPFFELSESLSVSRDIHIASFLKARLHLTHISTGSSLEIIKKAKVQKFITCDTCPHYLILDNSYLEDFDTNFKVNPPLPSEKDRKTLIKGLKEGVIDCITTDHAPHTLEEKESSFLDAPSGMIGLQTLFGLCFKYLVEEGLIDIFTLIEKITINPARILKMDSKGVIEEGKDADLVLVDLNEEFIFREQDILSSSKNTPFVGWRLKGKVKYTICGGDVVYKE